MIIGLTGKNAAGKGEVAKYLQKKGFLYYSLSDVIRDEATKRRLEHSRENLIKLGNELRENFGADYLAKQINKKILEYEKDSPQRNFFVIDSIRNPYEVKELRKNKNFVLIGVDAPIELRFERLVKRNRLGDAKTLEEFRQQEQKENLENDTYQQLDAVFKLADKVIINNGSLSELHNKTGALLKELKRKELKRAGRNYTSKN